MRGVVGYFPEYGPPRTLILYYPPQPLLIQSPLQSAPRARGQAVRPYDKRVTGAREGRLGEEISDSI